MTPEHDRIVDRLQAAKDGYELAAKHAKRGSPQEDRAKLRAETVEFCLRIVEEERQRTARADEVERMIRSEMAAQKEAT